MGKRKQEWEQGNKQGEGGGQVKSRGSEKIFFYEIRGLWQGWGGGGFHESQTFLLVRLCLVNYAGFNWQVQVVLKVLGFSKDRIE